MLEHARDTGKLKLDDKDIQDEVFETIIVLIGEYNPIRVTNQILVAY